MASHHSRWVIFSVLVLSIMSLVYTATHARINSDLSSLIRPSEDLVWHQNNEHYKNQFPYFEQTALVVVSGSDANAVDDVAAELVSRLNLNEHFHSVFAPGVDAFISRRAFYYLTPAQLAEWLKGVEYAYGPLLRLADEASVTNFTFVLADHLTANRGLPLPAPLHSISTSISSSIDQGEVRVDALPPLKDPDQTRFYQLIVLQGEQDLAQQLPNELLVSVLREQIAALEKPLAVEVRLSGEIPLAHEEIQAALSGVGLAGMISIVLLAIILGFGIRSLGFVLAIFGLLGVGVVLTLGMAVLVVGSFNTLSLIFVVMFFGLGVDFAAHFGLRVREARQMLPIHDALILAARDVGPALLLCMLTSSIAFLAFLPTDYEGLAELGVISAMGMGIAFFLTLTLLPALLSRVHLRQAQPDTFSLAFFLMPARPTILVFVALIVTSGWIAKDLSFDYSVLAMRDSNTEGMRTLLELQDEGITTDYSIAVLARDAAQAKLLTSQLERLDEVNGVTGPDDLVPAKQDLKQMMVAPYLSRFNSIDEVLPAAVHSREALNEAVAYLKESTQYARPADRELLSALIERLTELGREEISLIDNALLLNLTEGLERLRLTLAATPFDLAAIPADLKERLISPDGEYLLSVQPAADLGNREATTNFIDAVSLVAPNFAGRSVVEWGVGNVVVDSFIEASSLAFAGIFILLTGYFRSLLLPILVFVPVGITLLLTFAMCQLTGLHLNMANILVVPLIIGLGVDTGIHVVHRFVTGAAEDLHESSTARAVVISALTTIGTFFSLSFSPHLGAASIGLLLTVAISLLVVVTFVLLPVLLKVVPLATQRARLEVQRELTE
jgi:hopanoid biosynthesis associated RND transporter like protein HpnN